MLEKVVVFCHLLIFRWKALLPFLTFRFVSFYCQKPLASVVPNKNIKVRFRKDQLLLGISEIGKLAKAIALVMSPDLNFSRMLFRTIRIFPSILSSLLLPGLSAGQEKPHVQLMSMWLLERLLYFGGLSVGMERLNEDRFYGEYDDLEKRRA